MLISVFTPTYNRAKTLIRTYNSLLSQTYKNFEWVIVDDGSSDNTSELVDSWITENKITIKYKKQINSGKYKAYNKALTIVSGELFFVVDSDDWLPNNALEIIYINYKNYSDDSCAGIVGVKIDENSKLLGSKIPSNIKFETLFNLSKMGYCGERSIILKTKIAQEYPFPEETNEKFTTECVVFDKIDNKYKYYITNEILTICEYQTDGLSSNLYKIMLNNPGGYKLYYSQRINMATNTIDIFRYSIRYIAFKLLFKQKNYSYVGNRKSYIYLSYPLGYMAYLYYKSKANKR